MRLLWLPSKLRAWGLEVVEVPGWQTRGVAFTAPPRVALGHHTASPATAKGDLPTLRILRDGRPDLRGPLCQVAGGRSGVAYVLASGKAQHAGRGAWRGVEASTLTVGCEMEHPGVGPWSRLQLQAFDRIMAALLDGLGLDADAYCGHREWALPAGRKPDPAGVDLDEQRDRIARLLLLGPPARLKEDLDKPPAPTLGDDDMPVLMRGSGPQVYLTDGLTVRRWVRSGETVQQLRADGTRYLQADRYDGVLANLIEGAPIP